MNAWLSFRASRPQDESIAQVWMCANLEDLLFWPQENDVGAQGAHNRWRLKLCSKTGDVYYNIIN